MDSWLLEFAATSRMENLLPVLTNGKKISSMDCPELPLQCKTLTSVIDNGESQYFDKAADILWELYEVVPHLIPFQEFGNMVLDIKMLKILLTMSNVTDANCHKLTEEITKLFKIPNDVDFQSEENFAWFDMKNDKICKKLITFLHDEEGRREILSYFNFRNCHCYLEDIKRRVYEYVDKINKKIGIPFLEMFSRLSEHSLCKNHCNLKNDDRIPSKSNKVKSSAVASKNASRMGSKYLNKVDSSQETVENFLRNKPVRNANSGATIHNNKDTLCHLSRTNLHSNQEQTKVLSESCLLDTSCQGSVKSSLYWRKEFKSKDTSQGPNSRSGTSEPVCIDQDLQSTMNPKQPTNVNLNTSRTSDQLKSGETTNLTGTYCHNHVITPNQPQSQDPVDGTNQSTINVSDHNHYSRTPLTIDDHPSVDNQINCDVNEPSSNKFKYNNDQSIINKQQSSSSHFDIGAQITELGSSDQQRSHTKTRNSDSRANSNSSKSTYQPDSDLSSSDSHIATDDQSGICTIDTQPCISKTVDNQDTFKGDPVLHKTENKMGSVCKDTSERNNKWKGTDEEIIRNNGTNENNKVFKGIPKNDLEDKTNQLSIPGSDDSHDNKIQLGVDDQSSVDGQMDLDVSQHNSNNQPDSRDHHSVIHNHKSFNNRCGVGTRLSELSRDDQPRFHDQTRVSDLPNIHKRNQQPIHVPDQSASDSQSTNDDQLDDLNEAKSQNAIAIQPCIRETLGNNDELKGCSLLLKNQLGSAPERTLQVNDRWKEKAEETIGNNEVFIQDVSRNDILDKRNQLTFHLSEASHDNQIQLTTDDHSRVDDRMDVDANQYNSNDQLNNDQRQSSIDNQKNFGDQFAIDAKLTDRNTSDKPSSDGHTRSSDPQSSSNNSDHLPGHLHSPSGSNSLVTTDIQLDICSRPTCQSAIDVQPYINKTMDGKDDLKGGYLRLKTRDQTDCVTECTWQRNEKWKDTVDKVVENNGNNEVIKSILKNDRLGKTNQLPIHGFDYGHNNEIQRKINGQSNDDGQLESNINQPNCNNQLNNDYPQSIIDNSKNFSFQVHTDCGLIEPNTSGQPSDHDQTRSNDPLPTVTHHPGHGDEQSASDNQITKDHQPDIFKEPEGQNVTDIQPYINKTMNNREEFKCGALLPGTEIQRCTQEGNDQQSDTVQEFIGNKEIFEQAVPRNDKAIHDRNEKVIFFGHHYVNPSHRRPSVHSSTITDSLPSYKNRPNDKPTIDNQLASDGLKNVSKKRSYVNPCADKQTAKPNNFNKHQQTIDSQPDCDNLQNIEGKRNPVISSSNDNQPAQNNNQLNNDNQTIRPSFINTGETSTVVNQCGTRCSASANEQTNDRDQRDDSCLPSKEIFSNSDCCLDIVNPNATQNLSSNINLPGSNNLHSGNTVHGDNNIPGDTNEQDSFNRLRSGTPAVTSKVPYDDNAPGGKNLPAKNNPPGCSNPPGNNVTKRTKALESGNVPDVKCLPAGKSLPSDSSPPGTSDSPGVGIFDGNHLSMNCNDVRRDLSGLDVDNRSNVQSSSVNLSHVDNITGSLIQSDTSSREFERCLIDYSGNNKKVLLFICKTSRDADRPCSPTCGLPTVETQNNDNLNSSNNSTFDSTLDDAISGHVSSFVGSPLLFKSPIKSPGECMCSSGVRNYNARTEESFEVVEPNLDNSDIADNTKDKNDFQKENVANVDDSRKSKAKNSKDPPLNTNLNEKNFKGSKFCPYEPISAVLSDGVRASCSVQRNEFVSNPQKDNAEYVRDSQKGSTKVARVSQEGSFECKKNIKEPKPSGSLVSSCIALTNDVIPSCVAQMNKFVPEESAPCMEGKFVSGRRHSNTLATMKTEPQQFHEVVGNTASTQVSQKKNLGSESEHQLNVCMRSIKLEEGESSKHVYDVTGDGKGLNVGLSRNELKRKNEVPSSIEQASVLGNNYSKQYQSTEIPSEASEEKYPYEFNEEITTSVPLRRSSFLGEQTLLTTLGNGGDCFSGNTTQFKDCFSQTSFSDSVSQDSEDAASLSTIQSLFYSTESSEDLTSSSGDTSYEVPAGMKTVLVKAISLSDTESDSRNVNFSAVQADISIYPVELSDRKPVEKNDSISMRSLDEPNPCAVAALGSVSVCTEEQLQSRNVVEATVFRKNTVKHSRRRVHQISSQSDEESEMHRARKRVRLTCFKTDESYSLHHDELTDDNELLNENKIVKFEDDVGASGNYNSNISKNNRDNQKSTTENKSNELATVFSGAATGSGSTASVNSQIFSQSLTDSYRRLKRIDASDTSTSHDALVNEPKPFPCFTDTSDSDCKHERICDDPVGDSQQESTASEDDILPGLNKRRWIKKSSPNKNCHRPSRVSLSLRDVKRLSPNTLKSERIQFMDCIVKLRKLSVPDLLRYSIRYRIKLASWISKVLGDI